MNAPAIARPVPEVATSGLRIRGLTKSYAGRDVLTDLDLDIGYGELVALLGANGSGKSTALRCVVGLTDADSGAIEIDGVDVVGLHGSEQRAARQAAAMVFQDIALVRRRSVLDNVCAGALGRLAARASLVPALFSTDLREEAMACLDRVGLADRAHESAGRLSGGQQQRVAIARALCQRAKVLLADEPVSALDPHAAAQVMGLLAAQAHDHGLAVVTVLHQPDLAQRYADRVIALNRGRIAWSSHDAHIPGAVLDALYAPDLEVQR